MIVLFDTETTGLIDNRSLPASRQPEVIEFYGCGVDLDGDVVVDELDLLIRPAVMPLPEKIVKITGITDADLEGRPSFREVADKVVTFLESAEMVVAHNASFDKDAIEIELERLGKRINWPRLMCTVEQTIHLRGYRMTLSDLHESLFGLKFADAHRARHDVEALRRCVVELRKRGEI